MNPTQANSYVCHIRRAVPTQKKAQERIIVYYELFSDKANEDPPALYQNKLFSTGCFPIFNSIHLIDNEKRLLYDIHRF